MTDSFSASIHKALENPNLQAALDANAERRIAANQLAFASLPEGFSAARKQAHAVRADIIQNLDRYLEHFIQQARANGMTVHRAADAAQAVKLVLEIARQTNAQLVAKSKTMVGEEIGINPALEAEGLQVVETDLGEYIVQLRGERPAHIITPAVHLRREQVGQIFHEKLGVPATEDIGEMTAVARRVLRHTFLKADIGISGVNFGVAESGTLCLLTNEGNGRMVTSVPAVHIALMGIERLVRNFDDLALMLSLLPRSATGQKLTVYTSLINSPARAGEDGPRQRHIILVDNGRMAMRQSSLAEALYCIRCGACLNACPIFREIGGHAYIGAHGEDYSPYPGPIGSIVSPGLFGTADYGNLARATSLCGACKQACPVDIDLPKLLLRVRAAGPDLPRQPAKNHAPRPLILGLKFFNWAARKPWRYRAAQRLLGWFSRIPAPFSPWLRLPGFTGWGISRDLARPAMRPFHTRWKELKREIEGISPFNTDRQISGEVDDGELESSDSKNDQKPVERFITELSALGGEVHLCKLIELPEKLLHFLQSRGLDKIQAWEPAYLPDGIAEALRAAGIQVQFAPDPSIPAGLTGALAAAAETGTLVLPGGAGRSPQASLLPEIHLALLPSASIHASLVDVLKLDEIKTASSIALISGPSRTADIEMTLTIGVHGPKEVHVFCWT
jgi:L-lactate dehydrogenase complex protein LldF